MAISRLRLVGNPVQQVNRAAIDVGAVVAD